MDPAVTPLLSDGATYAIVFVVLGLGLVTLLASILWETWKAHQDAQGRYPGDNEQ